MAEDRIITYSMFLLNFRALITLIACVIMNIFTDFLDSILSVELQNKFGMSGNTDGYVFAIPFLIYALGCPVVT
jgi:hypothetical protein